MQKKILWVLFFHQVERMFSYFQNPSGRMNFLKMVSNFSVLEGIFEAKFQGWFFFQKKFKGISPLKFTPLLKKGKKLEGFLLQNWRICFIGISPGKLKVSSIFSWIFFCHFKGNFYSKLYGYWKNGASGIRPKLQTFFSYVLTTGINERLIRKFNYTNVHINI